jgi:hypothetical protein
MIGNVVGNAGEAVESQNRGAILRRDEQRGDGEILILVPLARAKLARADPVHLCFHCSRSVAAGVLIGKNRRECQTE